MQAIPNSSAMDFAAGGGGPTARVLPWIVSADPEQILRYGTELANHITTIAGIVAQISDTGDAMRKAWPAGTASDAALAKVQKSVQTFQRIVQAARTLQTELTNVATALRLVQQAYRATVSAVNPTVKALLSNVHTHAAARSLAIGTTAGLASSVASTKATLDAIAATRLMAVVSTLATIAKELESLLSADAPAPSR